MADETENAEIEETQDVESAEVEDVVEETAPEAEEPVAEAEPVVEAEAAPEEEPADDPAPVEEAAEEAEPLAAEAEPAADEPSEAQETEAADDADEAPAEVAAVSGPKPKRKRLPRSERPKKTRPKRVLSAERKPITRLPKPEHGRGRRQERQGVVVSDAADKTIVVRVDVVKLHPRYKKVVKRSTRFHAHDEENQAKLGDVVRIVETRPLSKLKRWRLHEVVEAAK
jgi:small subunit ribosomal protein S17